MAYFMNVGGKLKVTYQEWVNKHMGAEERAELRDALSAYAGPVSLEKFRKDFCNLSDSDRKEFIKTIQEAADFVKNGMAEQELDAAIQADLDRLNKEAYGEAWAKSVADAKARGEQAKYDIDAAIRVEADKLKQGVA